MLQVPTTVGYAGKTIWEEQRKHKQGKDDGRKCRERQVHLQAENRKISQPTSSPSEESSSSP